MELFAAKNIVKRYASHTALDNVSISITKQKVFGLLGPNGAGKTSLIRIMNQITGPDSGELFFEGADSDAKLTKSNRIPSEYLHKHSLKGVQTIV